MTEIEQLNSEIEQAEEAIKPKRERLTQLHIEQHKGIEERVKLADRGKGDFKLEELTFAAHTRCICGHGFAYPNNCGPFSSWTCSAILRGLAQAGSSHDSAMPFAFYELKSENQPSANGLTTRPKE
jgi:hypothetical protein